MTNRIASAFLFIANLYPKAPNTIKYDSLEISELNRVHDIRLSPQFPTLAVL